eukprot:2474599-Pleurochrysis_carterae.AAC.1
MSTRHGGAGTCGYEAPEQVDEQLSEKSAIHSFGIILRELWPIYERLVKVGGRRFLVNWATTT